ncbi:M61 family metallopeptidase [Botrimarina hoheduenensis]|uniref:M61 family metallopeptidase n=1 Tax=Botrimarina hoheduenensis TaxID=2528000 RepID=UPI0018D39BCC|nr:hypothetical protein [Botrimarina hoheduenensis]
MAASVSLADTPAALATPTKKTTRVSARLTAAEVAKPLAQANPETSPSPVPPAIEPQEPATAAPDDATPVIELSVDATTLHRSLLTSEQTIPIKPGRRSLWFANWVPGVAGPTGQIANLARVVFSNEDDEPLRWSRDPTDLNRFWVTVPEGVDRLQVRLTYLANQPTQLSTGVDTFGTRQLLTLNFNTCLVYPDGCDVSQTAIHTRVRVPAGWGVGTAIKPISSDRQTGEIDLGRTSLKRLVDSPLIAGRYYRAVPLDREGFPPTVMHLVGDSHACTTVPQERVDQLTEIMPQAVRLFGSAPFDDYAFLVVCTDRLPRFGLEHGASSLNCVRAMALRDDSLYRHRPAYLLPHELVHAWCGKHRLPEKMSSTNFHEPLGTELLWVYEGLTQYLMQLVAVRSGQVSMGYHREYLAYQVSEQLQRTGREWRPLSDTAVSAPTLRGGPSNWADLRRGQDYYDEGALFWLNVDCLLREKSGGKASMDDFCKQFFAVDTDSPVATSYSLDDLVANLESLADHPWRGMIQRHVYLPQAELALDGVNRSGYELGWVRRKPTFVNNREEVLGSIQAIDSLGIVVSTAGVVERVVPESVADDSGLRERSEVVAVNRRAFSPSVLNQELDAAAKYRDGETIDLIVREGQWYSVHELSYSEGPRHAVLKRHDEGPDLLTEILRSPPSEAVSSEKTASMTAKSKSSRLRSRVTAAVSAQR